MYKKFAYIFGSVFIVLLFINILFVLQIVLLNQYFWLFYLAFQAISITFFFRLKVLKALIIGIIGSIESILYIMYDIMILPVLYEGIWTSMDVSTFILRIIFIICSFSIQAYITYMIIKPPKKEVENIKESVLEMSEKYTIATIKEISEKSKSDHYIVSKVLAKMIKENQINADYFRRSKKVAFYSKELQFEFPSKKKGF